ncbi:MULTISPECIES: MFS transporter [unclassified Sphingobium]|uniref:MFS transporter n=1 Tax=unclassified Sphingobium TaxID=2611147 RepID=UPI0035A66682
MEKMPARPALPWPLIIAVLIVADVTATFETQMILAALKALYADLRDPVAVAWLVTTYLLVSSVAAPILGRLGDLFGRKRVIVGAIGTAAIGSALSAAHPDPDWIVGGRALQGVAGAVMPLCYGIVREAIPAQRHALCGGLLIGATSVGAIAGLVIGGLVVDHLGWRSLFWLSAAMAAAAALLAVALLPSGKAAQAAVRRLDIAGGVLFAAGAAGLLLVISRIGTGGLGLATLGEGACVVLLLAFWVRHELRHPDPLLDVRLLFRREMALTHLAIALVALGPFQLTLLMMLLLQQAPATGIGLGLTAAAAGVLKIPGNLGSVIVSPLAGQMCASIGERRVILFGFAANLASWLAMFLGYASFWPIVGVIILSSIGTTVAFVGVANQIARIAPPGRVSEALGVNVALRSIAHACGSQVMTILLGAATVATVAAEAVDAKGAYLTAFAFISAVCVAGLATAMALPRALPARA